MATRKKAEHLKEYDFQPKSDKPLGKSPVSVRLPEDLDAQVRSLPNRNQWLIEAIAEKLEREQQMSA